MYGSNPSTYARALARRKIANGVRSARSRTDCGRHTHLAYGVGIGEARIPEMNARHRVGRLGPSLIPWVPSLLGDFALERGQLGFVILARDRALCLALEI